MLRQSARSSVNNIARLSYKRPTTFVNNGIATQLNSMKNYYSQEAINIDNKRPEADEVLRKISSYVHNKGITSPEAYETARLCLLDTLGCGLAALKYDHHYWCY